MSDATDQPSASTNPWTGMPIQSGMTGTQGGFSTESKGQADVTESHVEDSVGSNAEQPDDEYESQEPEQHLDSDEEQPKWSFQFDGEDERDYSFDDINEWRNKATDYTKKTQATAHERKLLATEQAKFKEQQNAQVQEYSSKIQQVDQILSRDITDIDKQIAQYDGLDFVRLANEDPSKFARFQAGLMKLNIEKQRVENERNTFRTEQSERNMVQSKEALRSAHETLTAKIDNWSPQKHIELLEYTQQNYGMTKAESFSTDPRVIEIMHKARLYDEGLTATTKKRKTTSTRGTNAQTTTGGKASSLHKEYEAAVGRYRSRGNSADFQQMRNARSALTSAGLKPRN